MVSNNIFHQFWTLDYVTSVLIPISDPHKWVFLPAISTIWISFFPVDYCSVLPNFFCFIFYTLVNWCDIKSLSTYLIWHFIRKTFSYLYFQKMCVCVHQWSILQYDLYRNIAINNLIQKNALGFGFSFCQSSVLTPPTFQFKVLIKNMRWQYAVSKNHKEITKIFLLLITQNRSFDFHNIF